MVRPAGMSDAEAIHGLINYYAEKGRMLHRSLESIFESLRDFLVCCRDGKVLGCVAVPVSWKDLGEVRSLAVAPDSMDRGIGRQLMQQAIEDAGALGLKNLFTLTYEQEFFEKFGFRVVAKESLPSKVWRDCLYCPRADNCDETAMILEID